MTRFYRKETCDGLERLDELKKSALFETLVQLVKSIHLLVLCVIFIYAKLAEFKAVGEQVVLALRDAGDELFGKEQMSISTTNVKSEF